MNMNASVIVPAYNAALTLPACLNALVLQNVPADIAYEVIVVVDESADNTLAIAQSYAQKYGNIRVISDGRLGKSGTRNRGAQHAQGEILLFTDADCHPQANWIAAMVAAFADPDVVGIKGTYLTRQTHPIARFVQLEHEERYALMAQQQTIDFIDTYSAGYRRDIFLANGGFDMQLTYSYVEDQELSFRLARDGHKMLFVPDAHVYHQHPTSVWAYARRKREIAYWKALILQRHKARRDTDSRTPQSLKVQMGLALLAMPLLPIALLWKRVRYVLVMLMAVFNLSTLSFLAFGSHRDMGATTAALFMLPIRAFALAAGYIAGLRDWQGETVRQFLDNEPGVLKKVTSDE